MEKNAAHGRDRGPFGHVPRDGQERGDCQTGAVCDTCEKLYTLKIQDQYIVNYKPSFALTCKCSEEIKYDAKGLRQRTMVGTPGLACIVARASALEGPHW